MIGGARMLTDSYHEQVEEKRQRIEKVNNNDLMGMKSPLPSRLDIHHSKKKKKKTKLKFPLLKVLLTFFILLPISTILAYTYFTHQHSLLVDTKEMGGEKISYENSKNHHLNNQGNKTEIQVQTENNENTIDPSNSYTQGESNSKINESGTKTDDSNSANNGLQTNDGQGSGETNVQIVNHVVQPNETLFSIAMKYYHSQTGIDKIVQQNNIINNEIESGQTLQIPLTK
jgi:hypothetical protein